MPDAFGSQQEPPGALPPPAANSLSVSRQGLDPAASFLGAPSLTFPGATGVMHRPFGVGALLRYRWLALVVFVLVTGPAFTGIWLLYGPTYQAAAIVEVAPAVPRILYRTDENGVIPLYQQYQNDQAADLYGATVLQRVLERQDIRKTLWYTRPPWIGAGRSDLERLRTDLQVNPRRGTSLVDVRMTAADPREAALIANAVVDEYLKYILERSNQVDDEVYQEVKKQYEEMRLRIEGLRNGIDGLRGKIGHWTPEELLAQQSNRLDAKRAERKALEDKVTIAKWQLAQLDSKRPAASQPSTAPGESRPAEQPPYAADVEWRRLQGELQAAEDRVQVERNLGDEHPTMIRLQAAIEQTRKRLAEYEQRLEETWRVQPQLLARSDGQGSVAAVLAKLDSDIQQMEFEHGLKNQDISEEEKRVGETATTARMLQRDLNDLNDAESRFRDIRERKFTMEIERRAPASIRVQARAYAPTEPDNARRRAMFLAMSVLGGLALGVGAAYVRSATVPAVQHAGEVVHAAAAPFLGRLPLLPEPREAAAGEAPSMAECVRMVRTALLQRVEETGASIIQLTSAGPGAGKTTIAAHLAESLVRCGKRVLLVDADLRNPRLHERLAVDLEPGLLGLLGGQAADADAIICPGHVNLFILPAGRTHAEAEPELLANGVLRRHLDRWRTQFDVVLLDSSPILPVADARILSRQVDGTILVVREKHCGRSEVAEALVQLHSSGGRLLGVVFIGRHGPGRQYDGYYYHHRHGYAPPQGGAGAPGA